MKNNHQNQTVKINHPIRKTQNKNRLIKNNQAILPRRSMKEKERKRFFNLIQQVWS